MAVSINSGPFVGVLIRKALLLGSTVTVGPLIFGNSQISTKIQCETSQIEIEMDFTYCNLELLCICHAALRIRAARFLSTFGGF